MNVNKPTGGSSGEQPQHGVSQPKPPKDSAAAQSEAIYELVRSTSHNAKNVIGIALMTCDAVARTLDAGSKSRAKLNDVKTYLREISDQLSELLENAAKHRPHK